MKKILILLVVALLLLAPMPGVKLVRFTLVNKSGYDVNVWMTGVDKGQRYFLQLPLDKLCDNNGFNCQVTGGDKLHPLEQVYTVIPDTYYLTIQYQDGEAVTRQNMTYVLLGQSKLTLVEPTILGECPYSISDPARCTTTFTGEIYKESQFNPYNYLWYDWLHKFRWDY